MNKDDMADVANLADERNIAINKVGVKNIRYPLSLLDRAKGTQHTIGAFNMYVNLPHQFKGTHMSRFIEVLNEYRGEISIDQFSDLLETFRERLAAEAAHLEVEFPYFVEKLAPVSGAPGLMEYGCRVIGESRNGKRDLRIDVDVPVSTLCPCSKEIADCGAHNQRGVVTIGFRFNEMVWIEEIIEIAEASGSAAVYSLLKREDEKFLTEQAYKNPVFVEDVVRNVAQRLDADARIVWYSVEVENYESIHNHNAYAMIERTK
jgi:GTP cyclohydrolase IB